MTASRAGFERWLAGLRASGKTELANALEQSMKKEQGRLVYANDGGSRSILIFGRVVVVGPESPQTVESQMKIEEGGYFVSAVGEIGKPVGFALHGYEPVEVIPDGEPRSIQDVGDVRLHPVEGARKARFTGKVAPEGRREVGGDVFAWLRISQPSINTPDGGYMGIQGQGIHVELAADGRLRADSLSPTNYSLSIGSPYYWPVGREVRLEPGEETDIGTIPLEIADKITVTYVFSGEDVPRPFRGIGPRTIQFPAPAGFQVGDPSNPGLNVRIDRYDPDGGNAVKRMISSSYGSHLAFDLGEGTLSDRLDLDVSRLAQGEYRTTARIGHVYLLRWTYPKVKQVLFSIDKIEKLTPEDIGKPTRESPSRK
ncbi:MAG: hypothetical protein U0800_25655 [Isosphaeraceae bacterium]